MKYKRAQAALEFLTTYGWAFLVILVMISALAYFGVLKPSKLLPDRCTFGTEMECQDYLIDYVDGGAGDILGLRLKNNIGETIQITDAGDLATTSETATVTTCVINQIDGVAAAFPFIWASGEVHDFSFDNCVYDNAGFVAGDKAKVLVTVTYHAVKSGSSYKHDVQGEVYSTVK